nr:hypothetical protein [Tanacetum cinerariifolium]
MNYEPITIGNQTNDDAETGIFDDVYDDREVGVEADTNNLKLSTVKDNGIFISQDKYVADILKKFDFTTMKIASTPMEPNKALIKDAEAKDADVHLYRSMIRSLMYLTASRPDIMFVVYAYASDYAGASLDRKSTTGGCQFLGKRLISWQCRKQIIVTNSTTKAEYIAAASCRGQVKQSSMYGFGEMITTVL